MMAMSLRLPSPPCLSSFLSDRSVCSLLVRLCLLSLQVVVGCFVLNHVPGVCGGRAEVVGSHERPVGGLTTSIDDVPLLPDGVGDWVALSSTEDDRRSLQAGALEPALSIVQKKLFPMGHSVVLSDAAPVAPSRDGNKTRSFISMVQEMVFAADGSRFYYSLSERDVENNGSVFEYFRSRVSYRVATLPHGPVGTPATGKVITYWWPKVSPNGTGVTSADLCDRSLPHCNMTFTDGIELSKDESNLILTSRTSPPNLVYVSIAEGNRTSIAMSAESLQTIGLNPSKTTLFATSEQSLLSLDVNASGYPINGPKVKMLGEYKGENVASGLDPLQISPHSFVSTRNKTCLYVLDNTRDELLLTNISTSALPRPLNLDVLVKGLNPNDSIFIQTFAATPDGCNVFLTDVTRDGREGYLRWVKVKSPCKVGGSVEEVAHYVGRSLWGVAMQSYGEQWFLYLGTSDGKVLQLEVNRSHLHSCVPGQPPTWHSPSQVASPTSTSLPLPSRLVPGPPESSYPGPGGAELEPSAPSSSSQMSTSAQAAKLPPSNSKSLTLGLVIALPLTAVSVVALVLGVLWCNSVARRGWGTDGEVDLLAKEEGRGGVGRRDRGEGLQRNSYSSPITNTTSQTRSVDTSTASDSPRNRRLHPAHIREFSLSSLEQCTNNFSSEFRIAEKGGFGEVYCCSIEDKKLAIKVMTGDLTAVKRNQFIAEVNTLSRLHHANLVPLVGYCQEGRRSILVYPYFNGGSLCARLHKHRNRQVIGSSSDGGSGGVPDFSGELLSEEGKLPPSPPPPPLTLVERMCASFQIAKGIAYLHEGASPPIIHRDIKSANVLLGDGVGEDLHVVVADFGLAAIGEKVFQTGHDHFVNTSHVGGTFGYMSPEYMLQGDLSEKNDVYAFGVLLLEVFTGRKVVMPADSGAGWQTIVEWVRPFLSRDSGGSSTVSSNVIIDEERPGPLNEILDPCLRDQADGVAAKKMLTEMLQLANECSHEKDVMRPGMNAVVERIRNIMGEAKIRSRAG